MSERTTDLLGYLIMIIVLAPLASAGLAAALRSPVRRKAHQSALERFRSGKGRDPERMAIGPHRSFGHNFRLLTVGLLGFGVAYLALAALFGR